MSTNNWLEGRHALITGGGTGIGAATATHAARRAPKSRCSGAGSSRSKRIAAIVGGTAIACDVTDRAAIERAFDEARAANGPLDMSSSTPASATARRSRSTTRDSWDRIIATNLTAAFDGAQLALPDLLASEDKRLVFVASVAGLRGAPYAAPYAASKHGAGRPDAAAWRSNSPRPT